MIMNIMKIKDLLEKYHNGETTLEEEKQLQEFFSQTDIPANLNIYKHQFQFFIDSHKESIPDSDFEKKVLTRLNDIEKIPQTKSRNNYLYIVTGIAASILFVIGLSFQFGDIDFMKQAEVTQIEDTYKDPEKAYEETKKTLLFVSKKLNQGLDELGKINKLNKGLEEMNKLSIFNEYKQMIINL